MRNSPNLLLDTMNLNVHLPRELHFKLASSKADLESAFQLLHDGYVKHGQMKEDASGLWISKYQALPTSSTIIALWNKKVAGTISLIGDSALLLPIDTSFSLSKLRQTNARIAEISVLAFHEDFAEKKEMIIFPLFKYLFNYCWNAAGYDALVVAVPPAWQEFYQSIFCFEKLPVKAGAQTTSVGLSLNLHDALTRWSELYENKPDTQNLPKYLHTPDLEYFEYPDRKYFKSADQIMTPELLDYFFNQRTKIFAQLNKKELLVFQNLYGFGDYQDVIPKLEDPAPGGRPRDRRFAVKCEGQIFITRDSSVPITVSDVSANGFRATLESPIAFSETCACTINIGIGKNAELIVRPAWTFNDYAVGFEVLGADAHWKAFLAELIKEFHQKKQK